MGLLCLCCCYGKKLQMLGWVARFASIVQGLYDKYVGNLSLRERMANPHCTPRHRWKDNLEKSPMKTRRNDVKWAEVVLLNMAMKYRIETGPTIPRLGERNLESLEGHFSAERLSYIEPT